MQESSTRLIYDFQSLFYDVTFGRLVRRRIAQAISHMNIRPTDRVLDLGIGTGCRSIITRGWAGLSALIFPTGCCGSAARKYSSAA